MRFLAKNFMIAVVVGLVSLALRLQGDEGSDLIKNAPEVMENDTRLEYARVLSYLKRYDEALNEYRKILKENPDLLEAKIEIAKVYYYQGDYDQALQFMDQISPDKITIELKTLYGDIYMAKKDYPHAEDAYKKILKENPLKSEVKFKLADILSWQKRYDESLALYHDLVAAHPHDMQLRRKYAMVLLWSGNNIQAAKELKITLPENNP